MPALGSISHLELDFTLVQGEGVILRLTCRGPRPDPDTPGPVVDVSGITFSHTLRDLRRGTRVQLPADAVTVVNAEDGQVEFLFPSSAFAGMSAGTIQEPGRVMHTEWAQTQTVPVACGQGVISLIQGA